MIKNLLKKLFPSKGDRQAILNARTFVEKFTTFTNSGYLTHAHIAYYETPEDIKTKSMFISMFDLVDKQIITPHRLNIKLSTMQYLRYEPENSSFYFSMNHVVHGKSVVKCTVLELVKMDILNVPKLMKFVQEYKVTDDREQLIKRFDNDKIGV